MPGLCCRTCAPVAFVLTYPSSATSTLIRTAMPPRKGTVIRPPSGGDTEATPGSLAAPHEGVAVDELSPDVERVLAELGENASTVTVWRMKDAKPGEYDYVARLPAPEFTTEYIKEQFGGGEYKLIIVDAVKGALNPIFLSVDRRFVGKLFATMPTPVSATNTPSDPFKDRLLEVLLVKALTPPPAPPPSRDLETVLQVAALFKNDGGNSNGLELVKTVMETATAMASSMSPPEGLAGVAAQFLPVVEKLVSSRAVPPPRMLRPAPAAAAAAPPAAVSSSIVGAPAAAAAVAVVGAPSAHVAGTIVPKWLDPFKSLAPMLVSFADGGNDPTVYADVAIDRMQTDDTTFAAAVQAMNEGRLLSDLFALAPALQLTEARKEFAAQLVARIEEGLRELMKDEGDDDTDAEAVYNG